MDLRTFGPLLLRLPFRSPAWDGGMVLKGREIAGFVSRWCTCLEQMEMESQCANWLTQVRWFTW